MNCVEIRMMLHAEADGELDVSNSLELERHLNACPNCAAQKKTLRSLKTMMRDASLSFKAPVSLREKVIQFAEENAPKRRATKELLWLWRWIAFGATAVAAVTIAFRPSGISPHDQLLNEAVAGHVRSLMADHLTDVVSSDQHTVKPWFIGKLDFAPNVKDLAAQNFPLVGGRLDYLNGRAVAALVYRRDKHIINVFVWPASREREGQPKNEDRRGYTIVRASANGLNYCIISDVNSNTLGEFVNLLLK